MNLKHKLIALRRKIRARMVFLYTYKWYQRCLMVKKDINGTSLQKRALLSYIVEPYKQKSISNHHQNRRQAIILANVLAELGFDVDVYHYLYDAEIEYEKYDLILGFGYPIENSFYSNFKGSRIFYATETLLSVRVARENMRLDYLEKRNGVRLGMSRIRSYPTELSIALSNKIITTGNEWTMDGYKKLNPNVSNVPLAIIDSGEPLCTYDSKSPYEFLWIGGQGMLLKGLDLVLDAFSQLPKKYKLHICGVEEQDFFDLYKKELFETENVCYYGRVNVASEIFTEITNKAMFVICSAVAEAGCGSVLTAMSRGVIPVVNKESSIDVKEVGYELLRDDVDYIGKYIKDLVEVDSAELMKKSRRSYERVLCNYTSEYYGRELKRSIAETISI